MYIKIGSLLRQAPRQVPTVRLGVLQEWSINKQMTLGTSIGKWENMGKPWENPRKMEIYPLVI